MELTINGNSSVMLISFSYGVSDIFRTGPKIFFSKKPPDTIGKMKCHSEEITDIAVTAV